VGELSTPDDRRQVAELLGREPAGAFEVVVRHPDGSPVVIANAPLLGDGTPMPTRYWLVGEPERTWVGRLESTGAVDRAEAEVGETAIADAHARYAAERDALIDAAHTGPRPFGGVGGTRRGVKCLHAHYAWWLAGGDDPVGAWVAEHLGADGLVPDVDGPRAASLDDDRVPVGLVVAAIDCGTNSTRLLVARRGADGSLESIERHMRITRLGQGVDATGRLAPEAIDRTVTVLRDYRSIMDRHGVGAVRATATSAARDAANRDAFFGPAADALGAPLELLAGAEEGALSFAGATADLSGQPGSYLVVDIGGGSTEFVAGAIDERGRATLSGVESLDVGCVRITERFLASDPPTESELAEASRYLAAEVAGVLERVTGARSADTLIGLAGTVSTLASIDLGLVDYDRSKIHHHRLRADRVVALGDRLVALSSDRRRNVPGMESARAEVIVGGLVVLRAILDATGFATMLVSESDILDGLAASLLV
jgi:exopolyphosphatase/guanosine-5'-triphosphate,3'-diphosphate pyrophosphatase